MFTRTFTSIVVALVVIGGPLAGAAVADDKEKATRQLNDKDRAKTILQFLHFGSDYVGHKLNDSGRVMGKPGHFYLEYEYKWKVGGGNESTTLSFFFDAKGILTEIQIDKTTACFNQPFLLANIGIKVLGEAILAALKDNLTATEKRQLQNLIDNADAKGLLEFGLAIGLAAGK